MEYIKILLAAASMLLTLYSFLHFWIQKWWLGEITCGSKLLYLVSFGCNMCRKTNEMPDVITFFPFFLARMFYISKVFLFCSELRHSCSKGNIQIVLFLFETVSFFLDYLFVIEYQTPSDKIHSCGFSIFSCLLCV